MTPEELLDYKHALLSQQSIDFNSLVPRMLSEDAGVYAIFKKVNEGIDECYYIGRTTNQRRRIYTNHLQGNASTARLKKYLVEDPNSPVVDMADAKNWLINNTYFKFISIDNSRMRTLVECGLTALFAPHYIDIK